MIYDYIVIGSGFGGSVSAMRLAEKGYSVLIIEKGKRYQPEDFPKTNWKLRKYLWMPKLGCYGIQNLSLFRHAFILSGAGWGGGSLVYANTLMMPPDEFFTNNSWSQFNDWKNELSSHYGTVGYMLGREKLTEKNPEDILLEEVACNMGRGHTFDNVYVGVNLKEADKPSDPYFNGLGPTRNTCVKCGGCMVGCRDNAKNMLDKNYLYFAEKFGVESVTQQEVRKIEFVNGEYYIQTRQVTGFRNNYQQFRAKGIIVSGGVLGTMKLLLKQKYVYKTLPNLSNTLGEGIRTNSESLCTATLADRKLNNGVAISSIFKPDDDTFVEIVKYPSKSNSMRFLLTLGTDKTKVIWMRGFRLLWNSMKKPCASLKMLFNRKWADNTIIFLVMQSVDNSMRMVIRSGLFGTFLRIKNDGKKKVPAYIEAGQKVMHQYADKVGALPQNAITEIVFNVPSTAHILGGCPMGENDSTGLIDKNFKVFNYPNMYVLDGTVVQGNLGVNPSFTIAAMAEYAMGKIPEKTGNTNKTLNDQLKNSYS